MADFGSLAAATAGHLLRHLGGEPVTFHGHGLPDVSTTPSGAALEAIFEPNYQLIETLEDGAEVQTTAPAAWLRLDELQLPTGRELELGDQEADDPAGDQLTVAGARYGIQRAEHDQVGPGVLLVLFELVS